MIRGETTPRFVLASSSPSRLRVLRDAGIEPVVHPSDVDETFDPSVPVPEIVDALAFAKASAVAALESGALVLGCDSLLDAGSGPLGKPGTADRARERWAVIAGRETTLYTGHVLIDTTSGRTMRETVGTAVTFADPDPAELEAYIASGEPLQVAGAFTLEGRSAAFVTAVRGDVSNVMGLSVPALRRMLRALGYGIVELWG